MAKTSEARRKHLAIEHARRHLDEILDEDFPGVLRRAKRLLPDVEHDALFECAIRSIWRSQWDELPDDLPERYRAQMHDHAWLSYGVEANCDVADEGVRALAELLVGIVADRKRTAVLAGAVA